jgi:transcriptional regulator with XRE-family HTH domain
MSQVARRLWVSFGTEVRDARLGRGWSVRELAARAGVSVGMVYRVEAGQQASTETAEAIAAALSRRVELRLVDPRKRESRPNLSVDVVHSAMGEFEARHFRALGFRIGIDEPYQHYQFSGRGDVIVYDIDARALLHIENRTRFPDFQDMAGAFNNKRAYLGHDLAKRFGVPTWRSETHVIAALWSSEVLHALRLRTESFRSLCREPAQAFADWWAGRPPKVGAGSVLVVLDPMVSGRERAWVDLESALTARPRYRGYSDAADALATLEMRSRNGPTAAASSSG